MDRDTNAAILRCLQLHRELTRKQVAERVGASIPTVTSHIARLIGDGLIADAGAAPSAGGRKPARIAFVPDSRYFIAVDIRPHSVRAILADLDLRILYDRSRPLRDGYFARGGGGKLSGLVVQAVEKMRAAARTRDHAMGRNDTPIAGVGLSLPGTIDFELRHLLVAPNLGLENLSLSGLSRKAELPVFPENEANAAALAEFHLAHDVRSPASLAYVSVTEGIGVGVVLDGELYRGRNGASGEFGHMRIERRGIPCRCGRRGCWERYGSESALIEGYFRAGPGPDAAISSGGADASEKFRAILSHVDQRLPRALAALDRYADALSVGLDAISVVLDPDAIVLGGRITRFGPHLLDRLHERLPDAPIRLSTLADDAAILGAALLPRSTVIPFRPK